MSLKPILSTGFGNFETVRRQWEGAGPKALLRLVAAVASSTRVAGVGSPAGDKESMAWNCYDDFWKEEKLCQKTCFDRGHGYDGDDCSGGWAGHSLKFGRKHEASFAILQVKCYELQCQELNLTGTSAG